MNLHISRNEEDLSRDAAASLVNYIREVLAGQDRFTIALSGGSTPRKLYQLLAEEEFRNQVPWEKLHFFWGDERYVPYNDERNNARMAHELLLDRVPVNKENIHTIHTDIPPEESAVSYEDTLHGYFDDTIHSFDLVLLGLGDDAHTLSLFPGYDNIHEKEKWVMAYFLAEQDMYRITLTIPVVNRASKVFFLVAGGSKAVPAFNVLYGLHEPGLYPAQLIQPYSGNCDWFLDAAAAREIRVNEEENDSPEH